MKVAYYFKHQFSIDQKKSQTTIDIIRTARANIIYLKSDYSQI
jgi:hypothetical protein